MSLLARQEALKMARTEVVAWVWVKKSFLLTKLKAENCHRIINRGNPQELQGRVQMCFRAKTESLLSLFSSVKDRGSLILSQSNNSWNVPPVQDRGSLILSQSSNSWILPPAYKTVLLVLLPSWRFPIHSLESTISSGLITPTPEVSEAGSSLTWHTRNNVSSISLCCRTLAMNIRHNEGYKLKYALWDCWISTRNVPVQGTSLSKVLGMFISIPIKTIGIFGSYKYVYFKKNMKRERNWSKYRGKKQKWVHLMSWCSKVIILQNMWCWYSKETQISGIAEI